MTTAERATRGIVTGTWICAAIVMVTSAGNAVLTFGAIGGNRIIGLGLGIAVDIALCVGLIGDRHLALRGLTSHWGRALRITAAVMSVVLATGAALIGGHYFLAVLSAFLPVLLVVLCEYGQDVHLTFASLRNTETARPVTPPPPVLVPSPPAVPTAPPRPYPVVQAPRPETPARPTPPVPASRPSSHQVAVPDGLVTRARDLRASLTARGEPIGRDALRTHLTDQAGRPISERVARDLIRQLNTEPHLTLIGNTP